MHRILFLLFMAASLTAFADGGGVIAQEEIDGMTLTVFASPAPLRAGPADLSVMLQDAKTGDPVLDRSVQVSVTRRDENAGEAWIPPCCSMQRTDDLVPATHAAAQNKLLYAANVIVPSEGPIGVMVQVDDTPPYIGQFTALPPPAPAAAYWPFLAVPPLAVGLFAVNRRIRRH